MSFHRQRMGEVTLSDYKDPGTSWVISNCKHSDKKLYKLEFEAAR